MAWNIFGKGSASQQTVDPNQLAGAQGASTGPFPGHGSSGVSITTGPFGVSYPIGQPIVGGSGGFTAQQISTMMSTFMIGLTQEEKDELANLEQEHAQELKNAKLLEFRKLPAELRQYIISAYSWNEAVNTINQVTVEQSDRLKELKQKSTPSGLGQINLPFWGSSGTSSYIPQFMPADINGHITTMPPLPAGITIDDLKSAHMEQTLEEEMLDEK